VIVAVALVIVVSALALVAGVARLGDDDGAARVVVAVTGVVVLALVAVGAMAGLGVDTDAEPPSPTNEPAPRVDAPGPAPLLQPTVRLTATPSESLPPVPRAVGDLEDGTVVVLGLAGLEPGSMATVHQCPTGAVDSDDCRPGLPVTTSDQGGATVLVDLEERFDVAFPDSSEVECIDAECSIVVFGSSRLEIVTVFGEPAPPAVAVVADPTSVPPGGTLTATAVNLPSGARASFVVCRPDGDGTADCGSRTDAVVVDDEGRAAAEVTIGAGRCPRGADCAIAVVIDDGGPRAYAPLALIGRAGAAYDDARVRVGLAVAVVLLVGALVLLRRTDWTPVGGDPFAGVELPADPFGDEAGS
jgi:Neocarzinostatin family